MRLVVPAVVCVAVAAVIISMRWPASGEQLLVNPGFESGTEGWASIDAEIYPSNAARNGQWSLEMTTPGYEPLPDVFQWVPVEEEGGYEFSGWVRLSDPNVERVFLRISWFDASDQLLSSEDSSWLVGSAPEFRYLTTGNRAAPLGAVQARASVTAGSIGPMTIHLDDFSMEGPPDPTATPTLAPPSETSSPTPTSVLPSDTPTATATATASPTPSPTATQSVAPSNPATFSPTSTPNSTPSSTPNSTLTTTPSSTAASPSSTAQSRTPTQQPRTPTPTPTPSPIPTPTAAPEPGVYPVLTNGGFEDVSTDGTPLGWRKIGGTLASATQLQRGGMRSLSLTSAGTSSTKWAYQTVSVIGGEYYAASAFGLNNDPGIAALWVRVSWYATTDGSGEAIESHDSLASLEDRSPEFRELITGPIQAPALARTAKVRLMVRPGSDSSGTAYFDDARFFVVEAPTASPTPAVTQSPDPTPVQSSAATPTSPVGTPTPTQSPAMPTARPTATPAPIPEPESFDVLTNGSFEVVREDETPYGWRKLGGTMTASDRHAADGELSLALKSSSESTKWAHQAVRVQSTVFYEASAWVLNPDAEAEVRISWYSSVDGTGPALETSASDPLAPGSASFHFVTTGSVQAPTGASSARVRLLVRPSSASETTVYFDAATLKTADAAAADTDDPTTATGGRVVAGLQSTPTSELRPAGGAGSVDGTDVSAGGMLRPANVRPALTQRDTQDALPESSRDTTRKDALIGLLIGLPLLGIGAVAANDIFRLRRDVDLE